MQVRDKACARVRVGGCDVGLVLRCVLCGLSFSPEYVHIARRFPCGYWGANKAVGESRCGKPKFDGFTLSNGDEDLFKMDVAAEWVVEDRTSSRIRSEGLKGTNLI